MNNRTILFDLDNTLIDTNKLYRQRIMSAVCSELGMEENQYRKIETAYAQTLETFTDFDPRALAKKLTDTNDVSEFMKKTFLKASHFEGIVFDDVHQTIGVVGSDHPIGVFSQGTPFWQMQKLQLSGLAQLFNPELIFISKRKTAPAYLEQLPRPAVIVDDNPKFITDLLPYQGLTAIWIDRNNQNLDLNATRIRSLSELPTFI